MHQENRTNPAENGTTASLEGNVTSNIITVVRDPRNPLGKRFSLEADGTVSKTATVFIAFGTAVMHRVETHKELAALLIKVGDDPRAAIINASFDGVETGEEFVILSEREIEKQLGIPASDRAHQKGVHQIECNGKTFKAVGRFKENIYPSSWQLLDRDIDQHTPEQFASLTTQDWLVDLSSIIPGIDKVSYVETSSTSSRVMRDGRPVGGGNGHVWVRVANPADMDRARGAVMVQAAQADMTWLKHRFSRKEEGKVVGNSLTTLIDPSVWTPGRLVFCGQPTVGEGLTVISLSAVVHPGEMETLDTSAFELPDAKTVRKITQKAGVEMSVTADSNGLKITANDLTLATEIETKDHGILTVREILERGIAGKLRCQTPFRDSSSYAAFYSINPDGTPFVHDVGTSTTHWLN